MAAIDDLGGGPEVLAPHRAQLEGRGRGRQLLVEAADEIVAPPALEPRPHEPAVGIPRRREQGLALHPLVAGGGLGVGQHVVQELLLDPAAAVIVSGEDRAHDRASPVEHVVAVAGGAAAVLGHAPDEGATLEPRHHRLRHLRVVPVELFAPVLDFFQEQGLQVPHRYIP
jgi:hypothetical protein